ncbi:HAD family hydrolase [Nioella aestuarii]|uniref:HAD family hydrolase n=1 Tax=Nioella aestuarii TaxID=1662864 RepID=UPI003D7F90C7
MAVKLQTIGFDADDTLWQNETFFHITQARFADLLADFTERDHLMDRLLQAEKRNIGRYGFGIKGFMLSMIETAIEVTDHQVPATVISEILAAGQEMLSHPIHLLPYAQEAVERLADSHRIVLITKGDLLDQERKLAQSGLGELFHGVEIVSNKTPDIYAAAFARHGSGPDTAMMVGNSMKSDVVPAIQAGAFGTYVPHGLTWELEHAEAPDSHPRFHEIPDLSALPALIEDIES